MSEGPNTPHGEDLKREYADERDMDRFWEVAQLEREPARQWWYIVLILILIIFSIPWGGMRSTDLVWDIGPFTVVIWSETNTFFNNDVIIFGLPLWIWVPLGCALGLSILTAFAILRFWGDGDSDSD